MKNKQKLGEGCTSTTLFLIIILVLTITLIIFLAPNKEVIQRKNQQNIDSLDNEIQKLEDRLHDQKNDSLRNRIEELKKDTSNAK